MKKITLTLGGLAPRNRFAPAARARAAGRHGPTPGALRSRQRRELKRELADLHPPSAP